MIPDCVEWIEETIKEDVYIPDVTNVTTNVTMNRLQSRIVGGEEATEGTIKYIALIKVFHPHRKLYEPICAGAILSNENILTNAACASACNITENCQVFVGRVNVDEGGYEVAIQDTIWHKSFFFIYLMKETDIISVIDIGMIHIKKIVLSPTVGVIQLSRHDLISGSEVEVAGWGSNFAVSNLNYDFRY